MTTTAWTTGSNKVRDNRHRGTREGGGASPARIGIIGGGAAGLSAAHALRRAGYDDVTVLERSERVGGKCCTVYHEGRSYELGAAVMSTGYHHVRSLMKEVGMTATPEPSGFFVDVDTRKKSYLVPAPKSRKWLDLGVQCAKLTRQVLRDERLWTPGFADVPDAMCAPFSEWSRENGFTEAAEMMRPWCTGFGYGYFEEIPAAYILKYATLYGLLFELLDGGYGGLWERVARPLDVRCGVDIRRVVRDDAGVTVETAGETLRFDAIVLASPMDGALRFLDASPEERALFEKIRYVDYRVILADAEGLPNTRYTFATQHLTRPGEVMFWYKRWKTASTYTFYAIGDVPGSTSGVTGAADAMLRRLDGRLGTVHREERWRYFPHVSPEDMRAGFYRRLEALQGTRRTYYAGELMSFPTVETVVGYSRALVDRHFAGKSFAPRVHAR